MFKLGLSKSDDTLGTALIRAITVVGILGGLVITYQMAKQKVDSTNVNIVREQSLLQTRYESRLKGVISAYTGITPNIKQERSIQQMEPREYSQLNVVYVINLPKDKISANLAAQLEQVTSEVNIDQKELNKYAHQTLNMTYSVVAD